MGRIPYRIECKRPKEDVIAIADTAQVSDSELFQLRSMLRKACAVFQQKCIYLSIAWHVEFVRGKTDEAK